MGTVLQWNDPTTTTTTTIVHDRTVPGVSVQVLSESLCIDCQRFFQQRLIPTYHILGPSVMDLNVIPFGNSKIDVEHETVTCQHGEAECDANIWQECAVDQYPAPIYMEFFECLEGVLPMGHRDEPFDESIFAECAASTTTSTTTTSTSRTLFSVPGVKSSSVLRRRRPKTREESRGGMDFGKLKACHDDPRMAWEIQVKYAAMTPANHQFVPWVLVDHQFVDVDKEDLLQKVCQAYISKGGPHPACASEKELVETI
jgi:hypothetical protein